MSRSPLDYLQHIIDECKFILIAIPDTLSFEDFYSDEEKKRAIVRSLEIIGEATKNIPIDFKLKWKNIEWKQMSGMRDRLIHDYFGVDYFIVWDVIKNKIPGLKVSIESILGNESK
ncbi:MAG: DUF86 domain-containing protein [Bacteroidales bacterium]|nr:DUF86 domain-containing protein [Bacteroidales bacterium]